MDIIYLYETKKPLAIALGEVQRGLRVGETMRRM
jgi:hypothetical protein